MPRPRVRSSFLVFEPSPESPEIVDPQLLRVLVRSAFQQRRKTLRAGLRARFAGIEQALEGCGIEARRRPQTLSELEFVRLANELAKGRANS